METIVVIAVIIAVILFVVSRFSMKGVENISIEEVKERIKDKNVQFIDVRSPGEYQANHRKPFKNVPLGQLMNYTNKLDKNKEVVIICQSGARSMRASKLLKRQGFERVLNVKGGMSHWY